MTAGKEGLAALFFVVGLFLAAFGSSSGVVALWAGAAAAVGLAALAASTHRSGWSPLAMAVVAYAAIMVTSVLWVGPVYSAAGLYHALLLVAAFGVVRSLGDGAERKLAAGVLFFALSLAVWAIADVAILGLGRAHALFETPATLATVLNIALMLAVATVMAGNTTRLLVPAAILIAAAVFLAASRGGWIALAAGLGLAAVLAARAGLWRPRAFAVVLALLLAGWLAATAIRAVPPVPPPGAPDAESRTGSAHARLELYALSLDAWRAAPLTGTGYLTFRYVLEQGRAQVPSYGDAAETWFVHNDYLQSLQELGPLGLLALLSLAGLPPFLAWRRLPALPVGRRPVIVAACAALWTMAVHASVDFPFYVPVCLLLYGAILGALDRRLSHVPLVPRTRPARGLWVRVSRLAAVVIGMVMLLRPVAAEAAAAWGLRELTRGHGRDAAVWIGAARRIEPRDWRYHWYAGQFWDMQTVESQKHENAQLAADAYAAGYAVNPLEVRNLLGLISVHQRYRDLLREPVDAQTLRAWSARAAALAPRHPQVVRGLAK